MDESVALELAEVGAVPGSLGDSEESTSPGAPSEAYLDSASDILAAIHSGLCGLRSWLGLGVGLGNRIGVATGLA